MKLHMAAFIASSRLSCGRRQFCCGALYMHLSADTQQSWCRLSRRSY